VIKTTDIILAVALAVVAESAIFVKTGAVVRVVSSQSLATCRSITA